MTPDPGSGLTPAEASDLAARSLAARAAADGVEVRTHVAGDGTVDAWVPVARRASDSPYLWPGGTLLVYDLAQPRLRGTPDAVLDRVGRLPPRAGGAGTFVVILPGGGGVIGIEASRAAATAAVTRLKLPGSVVRHVPAGYAFAAAGKHAWVVDDVPLVGVRDVTGVRLDVPRRGIALRVGRQAADAVAAARRPGLVWRAPVGVGGPMVVSLDVARASGDDVAAGITVRARAEILAHLLAGGNVPATISVAAQQPTGPAPRAQGELWGARPLPPRLQTAVDRALSLRGGSRQGRASLRRVLSGPTVAGPVTVWTMDLDGHATVITDEGLNTAQGGRCEWTAAQPVIVGCLGSPRFLVGRVSDRVARIEGAQQVTIKNGWFLASSNVPRARRAPLVAFDREGRRLATLSSVSWSPEPGWGG